MLPPFPGRSARLDYNLDKNPGSYLHIRKSSKWNFVGVYMSEHGNEITEDLVSGSVPHKFIRRNSVHMYHIVDFKRGAKLTRTEECNMLLRLTYAQEYSTSDMALVPASPTRFSGAKETREKRNPRKKK